MTPDTDLTLTSAEEMLEVLRTARSDVADACTIDVRDTRVIKAWTELARCAVEVWKERAEGSDAARTYFANLDAILLGNTETLLAFKKLISRMAEEEFLQLEFKVKSAELRRKHARAIREDAQEAELDDLRLATKKTEERMRAESAEHATLAARETATRTRTAAEKEFAREEELREAVHQQRLTNVRESPDHDDDAPSDVRRHAPRNATETADVASLRDERTRRLRHDCERIVLDISTGTVLCDDANRYHGFAALVYTRELRRTTPEKAFATTLDTLYRRRDGQPQMTITEARSFFNQYNRTLEQADAAEGLAQARDILGQLGVAEDRYASPS